MTLVPSPVLAPARTRVPIIIPPHALIGDVADKARALGLRLVTDGRRVYVTPRLMPGEFAVGVPVAVAA